MAEAASCARTAAAVTRDAQALTRTEEIYTAGVVVVHRWSGRRSPKGEPIAARISPTRAGTRRGTPGSGGGHHPGPGPAEQESG